MICVDCGGDAPLFMVRNDVWRDAGMPASEGCHSGSGGGWLCPSCIERRLGRALDVSDFAACKGTMAYLRSIGRDDWRAQLLFGDDGISIDVDAQSVRIGGAA